MPYNGSGTFYRNYNWVQDYTNGILIQPDRVDNDSNDFANGLTNCITRDGQGKPAANISWNNCQINFLANPTLSTDALNLGYADGRYLRKDGSNAPTASIDAGSFTIINVGTPVNPTDAATKSYVDTATSARNLNNFQINGLAAGVLPSDAVNKAQLDAATGSSSSGTLATINYLTQQIFGGF